MGLSWYLSHPPGKLPSEGTAISVPSVSTSMRSKALPLHDHGSTVHPRGGRAGSRLEVVQPLTKGDTDLEEPSWCPETPLSLVFRHWSPPPACTRATTSQIPSHRLQPEDSLQSQESCLVTRLQLISMNLQPTLWNQKELVSLVMCIAFVLISK